jgi:hypothetical protein
MDYTTLSLNDVRTGLEAVGREAEATFGGLDDRQLNWRPDDTRWSVAQCFEHLLTADTLMLGAAHDAMNGTQPRTVWQRLPLLPRFFGRSLIRSQSPTGAKKYKSPSQSRPTTSAIAPDIIQRFVRQHRDAVASLRTVDERSAAHTIMTSPFVRVISYSVMDGLRIVVAHDRRHFEQARRVMVLSEFPKHSRD